MEDETISKESTGKGKPLLLIPGGPGSSHSYFYPAMERLADAFQLIYFDAFGRGKSDRAKHPGEYSLAGDIDDVEGQMEEGERYCQSPHRGLCIT